MPNNREPELDNKVAKYINRKILLGGDCPGKSEIRVKFKILETTYINCMKRIHAKSMIMINVNPILCKVYRYKFTDLG